MTYRNKRTYSPVVLVAAGLLLAAWGGRAVATGDVVGPNPFSISVEAKRAIDMNQIFHGTFSSQIRDGKYEGRLDSSQRFYVPTRKELGTLFTVPKKDEFDSVRINVLVSRGATALGVIRGGIVYWKDGVCVIGFGSIQKPDGQYVAVRGYMPVGSLPAQGGATELLRPGASLFIPHGAAARIPIVVDHTLTPPSDEADDD